MISFTFTVRVQYLYYFTAKEIQGLLTNKLQTSTTQFLILLCIDKIHRYHLTCIAHFCAKLSSHIRTLKLCNQRKYSYFLHHHRMKKFMKYSCWMSSLSIYFQYGRFYFSSRQRQTVWELSFRENANLRRFEKLHD